MKQTIKVFVASLFLSVTWMLFSASAAVPERILSISPAGTEILFELGLGERVVGVTEFCTWPPEARTKLNLGDLMHVSLEVVIGARPDIILVSPDMNSRIGEQLEALGYHVVAVHQDNFEQICDSMLRVGRECGVEETAKLRIAELKQSVLEKTVPMGATPPRVLVAVGRDPSENLKRIYIAGQRTFYNDLLTKAGAVNAYDHDVAYAHISLEGLLRIDPDVIIELIGEHGMEIPAGSAASPWGTDGIRAARDGRVSIIEGDFVLRPGPRYPQILEAFIEAIHGGGREQNN